MLKFALLGIWVIVVTAASTLLPTFLATTVDGSKGDSKQDAGVEELESEMLSIPIVRAGEIAGYLIIQLSFEADRNVLAEKKLDPVPYLIDSAFRVTFSSTDTDFQRLQSRDLEQLTAAIAKDANQRFGAELVRHVLIQQLNFVHRDDIRTNWIGKKASGHK